VLQLRNDTPFRPGLFVFPDEEGIDTLYVAVKATYAALGSALVIADAQRPLVLADQPHGEGSSLRYAGEAHLCKPATDVILVGEAYAPRGRPAAEVDVHLRVGPIRKVVRVFGERTWRPGLAGLKPSSPEPFTTMPLVYERAFGGAHQALFEPRNPVGVGFRGKRTLREMEGTRVPNLEDPRALLQGPDDQPAPACFGSVAPSWEPRRSFAGTYDEAWKRTRAPYLPSDFSPRFFNAAAPDLVAKGHLRGGEPVEILNAAPEGLVRFDLPGCPVEARVSIAGDLEVPELRLETVLLEPAEGIVSLLYRGAVRCDKRVLSVDEVRLGFAGGRR
jgi:hypothetical protein